MEEEGGGGFPLVVRDGDVINSSTSVEQTVQKMLLYLPCFLEFLDE